LGWPRVPVPVAMYRRLGKVQYNACFLTRCEHKMTQ
jgi:hypothetical protein